VTAKPPSSNESPAGPLLPDISQHVDQVGDQFLDLLQAGESPDRHEVVQAYRQLTDRLEQRLALIELMFRRDPVGDG
jgi:hypothetical protein